MGIWSRILGVACMAMLMLVLGACSGKSDGSSAELLHANSAHPATVLPTLQDMDGLRQSSVATQLDIDPQQSSLTGGQVGNQGADLMLNSSAGTSAWALYAYQAGSDPLISLRLTFSYPNGPGAWVALANYQTGRWEWQPKAQLTQVTYQLSTNPNRNFVSPKGNMYFVVLSADDRDVLITDLLMVADLPPPPTFTISGHVQDPNQSPLNGILIGLNPGGLQTTTNASGDFSFADIDPGNYTITPSDADYAFLPVNRPANVSTADVTGMDFVGESTAVPVTYVADIEALIDGANGSETSCLDCHSGQFPEGDLDLTTYTSVKDNASKINDMVNKTSSKDWMPKDGDKWSQQHLDLFQQWIDDGLLEQ